MHINRRFHCILFALGTLFLISEILYGQGVSGITVQAIHVNPAEFRPGQSLTITIDLKAPTSGSATGAVRAYVNAYKGDANTGRLTWLATDWLAGLGKDETALASGEVRTAVSLGSLTIPSDPANPIGVIYLVAGAFDPPSEFAQEKIVAFDFQCPGGKTGVCRYIQRKIRIDKWVGGKK